MEENDRMNRDMTVISGNNMAFLMGEEKTPRQMVEFLKEGAMFRGFNDVLKRVYPGEDLASRLAQGLSEMTGEEYGSISRKVRNWLKGQNMPKNRGNAVSDLLCLRAWGSGGRIGAGSSF